MTNLSIRIKNFRVMSIAQIRVALIKQIMDADEASLKKYQLLLKADLEDILTDDQLMSLIPPPPDLKPLTEEELMERLEKSRGEIERGEYISLEDLKKESEQW